MLSGDLHSYNFLLGLSTSLQNCTIVCYIITIYNYLLLISFKRNVIFVYHCRQKQELYWTPASKDVTPMSGYLNFTYGLDRQFITIASVDNNLPQPNRLFSVRLVASTGLTPVADTRLAIATLTGGSFT